MIMPDELTRAMAATLSATRAMVTIGARQLYDLDPTLTLPQYRAIVVLSYGGPKLMSELADNLGVSRATAGRIAARLQKAAFVELTAVEGDGRATRVILSERGREVIRRVSAYRQSMFEPFLCDLSPAELTALASALEKFVEATGEPGYNWDSDLHT
jgi:DNA-binding MarR family transcriptional regulator